MEGPQSPHDEPIHMEPADAALLDRLVESGFDPSIFEHDEESTQARGERLVAMLGLLGDYPVEPLAEDQRDTLVAATLARIDREEDAQRDRMRLDSSARLPRLRLREFVAIAAVIIVGAAIVFPMMQQTAELDRFQTSQANLLGLSAALTQFERDHSGEAPATTISDEDYRAVLNFSPTILDVVQLQQYGLEKEHLLNPMRPGVDCGYSFHSQEGDRIFRNTLPASMAIASDRNPFLDLVLSGQSAESEGDMKVCLLLQDGSVALAPCRVTVGPEEDHIWDCDQRRELGPLAKDIFLIHGRLRPSQPSGTPDSP